MRPSPRLLISGLTIFTWSVSAAYASVNPYITHTEGISRRHHDAEKRQIRNADYGSSGSSSPKSVYDESEDSVRDSTAHDQQSSKPSRSDEKEKRGLFEIGDSFLLGALSLNDLSDLPLCEHLVEFFLLSGDPYSDEEEGQDMTRRNAGISQRTSQCPACARRMAPVGTKSIRGFAHVISRANHRLERHRWGDVQHEKGSIELHRMGTRQVDRARKIVSPRSDGNTMMTVTPTSRTDSTGLDNLRIARGLREHDAPANDPSTPRLPRDLGYDGPSAMRLVRRRNQRDSSTVYGSTKPDHDERVKFQNDPKLGAL
ncbi:hypothetical protein D9615_002579 [Tricholomella constricta]|uniref:Uncharacterized protein n=1 Tax=Tricholomella constricta TaxID=117010 RepID=A0A8H5HMS2_9AGAR|nr:hypothetical protein D9615_002579 [Tricholomella constricta]